jgi:hypothetical protein
MRCSSRKAGVYLCNVPREVYICTMYILHSVWQVDLGSRTSGTLTLSWVKVWAVVRANPATLNVAKSVTRPQVPVFTNCLRNAYTSHSSKSFHRCRVATKFLLQIETHELCDWEKVSVAIGCSRICEQLPSTLAQSEIKPKYVTCRRLEIAT